MAGNQAIIMPQESKTGLSSPNYGKCSVGYVYYKDGGISQYIYGMSNSLNSASSWVDSKCKWNTSANLVEMFDRYWPQSPNDLVENSFTFNIRSTQSGEIINGGWTQMKITGSRLWYDANADIAYLTPLVKTYNRVSASTFGRGGSSGNRTAYWRYNGPNNWAGFEPWRTAPPAGTPMTRISKYDTYLSYPSIKIEWT